MRNLLRCRRGSVAFATVIALIPLIGVVALGAEAGSWYVTKQHAQSAADAAAYSGGLTLACTISGSTNCDTGQDYVYRGKQFAAQNAFCNSGESYTGCASLPAGTSQVVQIDRGSYAAGAWTSSASGNFVRAVVSQQQPTSLAGVLGLSTVNIGAQAIVEVKNPKDICTLGLGPSESALTIGGSSTITGKGCALMSDNSVKYNSTPNFSGSGWAVDAASGCIASADHCNLAVPYNYNMLPATNPLKVLDTASFNTMPTMTGNSNPAKNATCSTLSPAAPAGATKCYTVSANTAGTAYGSLTVNNGEYVAFTTGGTGTYFFNKKITINGGGTATFAPGTYYINGDFGGGGTINFAPGTYFFKDSAVSFGGTVTCTGCTSWSGTGLGVTLVLLGNSNLSISGTANVSLSAPKTNTAFPDLSGVLIDDQAPTASKNAVTINGGGSASLGGAMYFPNVDVTWGGTVQNANTSCTEVIANTVTINGNAYMSTQSCAAGTIAHTQVVALVQ